MMNEDIDLLVKDYPWLKSNTIYRKNPDSIKKILSMPEWKDEKFKQKFNLLNKKYHNNYLQLIASDMNYLEEMFVN